jgi:hypothetical protein
MVMWTWMYVTRLPAIRRARMKPRPQRPARRADEHAPARTVRWKADNYNHLMEQPTLFYAVALSLALLGRGAGANLALAWSYVVLRVAHSLVQATWNKIEVRFAPSSCPRWCCAVRRRRGV